MATITVNVDNTQCFSTQEVFVVTVIPQNDTPVGQVDTIQVDEGGTVTTTTTIQLVLSMMVVENGPLNALVTPPLHHQGSLVYNQWNIW